MQFLLYKNFICIFDYYLFIYKVSCLLLRKSALIGEFYMLLHMNIKLYDKKYPI